MIRLLRGYPLTAFFVLAYGVTWILWAPVVIAGVPAFSETRHVPSWYALPAVAVGVTGTAFAMTAVTGGRAGVRRLLQRLTCWRVGARWYLVAFLTIPLVELVITAAATGTDVLRALTPAALALYPAAFAAHFVFGPLFEESGWRGFALPRMQERFGPMRGTLLLGGLWAGWHFFLYAPGWISGGAVGLAGLAVFVAFTVSISVLFTWLSNNTGASLLLVMLLHGSINGTATWVLILADRGVIPSDAAQFCAGLGALAAAVLTAGVLTVTTRRLLCYSSYRSQSEHLDLGRTCARG